VGNERKDFHPFVKDESVHKTRNGAPPPNHARRCQSFNLAGTQCGRWAITNQSCCEFHGGTAVQKKKMSWSYKNCVGPTLRQKLEEIAADGEDALHDLSGEVAIMKSICERVFITYEQVVIEGKLDKDGVMNHDARMAAMRMLKDTVNDVSKLLEKAAKVQALRRSIQPVLNAGVIADKITIILFEELEGKAKTPEEKLAARKTAERITEKIREIKILKDDVQASRVTLSIE
jgi:hypothetical protein